MNHKLSVIRLTAIITLVAAAALGMLYIDQSRASAGAVAADLFFDDFSGDLSQWQIENGDWYIGQGELVGTGWGYGTDGWIYAGDYAWEDYVLQADVHFVNDNAMLVVRSTQHWYNEYRIDVWRNGGENSNAYSISKYFYGSNTTLASGTSPVPITDPCTVRVMVNGTDIYLYINGTLVTQVEDLMPLTNGRIGLGVIWYYTTRFDNVVVTTLPPILLVPPEQEKYGRAGSTVTYEVELENHTGAVDSFDLSVLPGNGWPTSLSVAQLGPIEDGGSASFNIMVEIPPEAQPMESDPAVIQAASVSSPSLTATASVLTSVTSEQLAYVPMGGIDSLALIDAGIDTPVTIGTIDLAPYGCDYPQRVRINPAGTELYITCSNSQNIIVLDLDNFSLLGTIPRSGVCEQDVAFVRDGAYALASTNGCQGVYQIDVIDTATYAIIANIPMPNTVISLAAHPYLPIAYAACGSSGVCVINTNDFSLATTIPFQGFAWDVQPSPDGLWLYASDNWGYGMVKIDASTNTVVSTLPGYGRIGLSISPDGSTIYASNQWYGDIQVIDAETFSPITSIWVGVESYENALTCDGDELYVATSASYVPVVDTQLIDPVVNVSIPSGGTNYGITICPQYVAQGAFLIPPSQAKNGGWGEVVTYELTLFNNSGSTETFDLQVSGNVWDTQLSTYQVGPLADGESATFTAYVTVPVGEPWYNTDAVSIQAAGVGDPSLTAEASLTTTAYAPPQIGIDPTSFASTQYVGDVTTQTLTISNGEGVDLSYEIYEGTYPGNVAALHLDEPYGATTFADTSGYGNQASCTGEQCPVAGVPGAVGTALEFDGVNDNLQIPHNAAFDQIEDQDKVSAAAWIYVNQWSSDAFVIMNQYGEEWNGGWEFGVHSYQIYFVAYHFWSGVSCSYYFNTAQWYHVAMTYDRSAGTIQFYVDGSQVCNINYANDISDTVNNPMYIGVSATDYDEYSNGLIDEFYIFDRALTSSEVAALYQGSLSGQVPWLSVDPASGEVPTNSSAQVVVTFDSTMVQPGSYGTELYINNNDPLLPQLTVPVDLTVEPSNDMGQVAGTVTDAWSGDPLLAMVELEGVFTTLADPDYSIWGAAGSYSLTTSAAGYFTVTLPAEIIAGEVTTLDVELEPALPRLDDLPAEISMTVPEGSSGLQALELWNNGPVPLDFAFYELDSMRSLKGVASLMGKDILYDMYHGQGDTSPYSTLVGDLIDAGATIDGNSEPIDEDTLEGYDILWITGGGGAWSYPELVALDQWLDGGGTVLIQGDNSPAVSVPASIFGIEYLGGNCYYGTTTLIYPHPITEGVDEVYYDWTCSHLNDTPDVIVQYTDLQPHMVAAIQGRGKMVVVASSDFSNGPIMNSDNRLLAMNTFLWLSMPVYGDIPWLSETPASGTVPGHGSYTASLTFDASALTAGEYEGFLAIEHTDGSLDSPILIPVHLTVTIPVPEVNRFFLPVVMGNQGKE